MALRSDVFDLASESLSAALLPRQREYPSRTRKILAEMASRGIHGGPTAMLMSREAIDEIEKRVEIATKELERATESKGVRYYKNLGTDLGEALQRLCDGRYNDVLSDFNTLSNTLPNPAGSRADFGSGLFNDGC
jgi:hypothetical protein